MPPRRTPSKSATKPRVISVTRKATRKRTTPSDELAAVLQLGWALMGYSEPPRLDKSVGRVIRLKRKK